MTWKKLGCLIVLLLVGLTRVPASRAAEVVSGSVEDRFRQFDKNGDGKIEREEMPEQFRPLLDRLDANRDGLVTAEELSAYYQRTQPISNPPGTGAKPPAASAPDMAFKPDDVRMGGAESAYIDPEFLQTEGLVVFLDSRLDMWVRLIPQPRVVRLLQSGWRWAFTAPPLLGGQSGDR